MPATAEHAEKLAATMRAEDAAEVMASGGYCPLEALLDAIGQSEKCGTALFDGEVSAMYGVAPVEQIILPGEPRVGIAWLLTGTTINRFPKSFAAHCRMVLREMLDEFPVLVNAIDARYKTALRWAEWCGFEVAPAIPFGAWGMPFHPILMRRKNV